MSDKIIHRGETMLISIDAEDFPVTDLSDFVLIIIHNIGNIEVINQGFKNVWLGAQRSDVLEIATIY